VNFFYVVYLADVARSIILSLAPSGVYVETKSAPPGAPGGANSTSVLPQIRDTGQANNAKYFSLFNNYHNIIVAILAPKDRGKLNLAGSARGIII